jgi:ribonucleotide monophosphatase NagD (HAD superfamily)
MVSPIVWFVFDQDGTVYLGEPSLPGTSDSLAEFRRHAKRICYVSNKPREPGRAYAAKRKRLEIPTEPTEVIT